MMRVKSRLPFASPQTSLLCRSSMAAFTLPQTPLSHTKNSLDKKLLQHHRPMFFRSSTSLHGSFLSDLIRKQGELAAPVFGVLSIVAAGLFWKYRGEIQGRLRILRDESWIFGAGVTMERIKNAEKRDNEMFANLKLLELSPDFVEDCRQEGWSVYSLGDYMSSLRPKQMPKNFDMNQLPKLIQREIEAGLAAALLKVLGPNLGRALLPVTGIGAIQRRARSFATDVATKWFLTESGSMFESHDKGGIPVSLMTLLAASDLNARVNSGKDVLVPTSGIANMNLSAIDKMKAGEVVKGPSFACSDPNVEGCLMPAHNFIVDQDFDDIIEKIEHRLAGQNEATGQTDTATELLKNEMDDIKSSSSANGSMKKNVLAYDPDDRRLPEPVPVNPRLFPGLHLGHGKAICSHTKREVLKMRLISILLNRLGSNYFRAANDETDEIFTVRMKKDGKAMTTPWEFVQALSDSGHKVEVVPSTRLTTFGVNLCVKEDDGSWSNIPLGIFLESGYEDRQGRMAPAMMPHSGLDMIISGPMAGSRGDGSPSTLRIQHFNGIEGFCGWHANESPEVPFNVGIETGPRLGGKEAVRAARIAGLYASVLNGLSSELKLPFGGYGLTAVCNDSAALVQKCLYDDITIYPMTSVGRFLQRTMRYGQKFADQLSEHDGFDEEVEELAKIAEALKKIPSDLNASPGNAADAAKRMLSTLQPNLPFLLAKDSKVVMESILNEEGYTAALTKSQKKFALSSFE